MSKLPIVERLEACPDIANARIVAPGMRTPEVVVPASLRDEAATTITELVSALEQGAAWFEEYAADHSRKAREASDSYERGARRDKAKRNEERAAFLRTALSNTRGDTKNDKG